MAVLQENSGNGNSYHLFEMGEKPQAPKGTYAATIINIKDVFGVERRKFDDPSQTEKVDLTAFLFGFRDRAGNPFEIDSRPMKISGNEKSALFAFLKSILGESPKMGWDYVELKGKKCLITVESKISSKGTQYSAIAAVSPLPDGYVAPPVAQQQAARPAAPAVAPRLTDPVAAYNPAPDASDDNDGVIPF